MFVNFDHSFIFHTMFPAARLIPAVYEQGGRVGSVGAGSLGRGQGGGGTDAT